MGGTTCKNSTRGLLACCSPSSWMLLQQAIGNPITPVGEEGLFESYITTFLTTKRSFLREAMAPFEDIVTRFRVQNAI